jgi:hypothetical protein
MMGVIKSDVRLHATPVVAKPCAQLSQAYAMLMRVECPLFAGRTIRFFALIPVHAGMLW